MAIVPGLGHPRLLLPIAHRRPAAQAVLRQGQVQTVAARAQRRALAWTIRSGAGRYLFRHGVRTDDTPNLIDHLETVLGERVLASLALTSSRANRKPVLQLLDEQGRSVAFVKVGVNTLTRDLVRRETDTLRRLAQLTMSTLRVPQVVHGEVWNGLELLVLSPLPIWRGNPPTPDALSLSMREVAASADDGHAPGAAGGYARVLMERAKGIHRHASDEDRGALNAMYGILQAIDESATASLRLGSWHGDWTPWNCRQLNSVCLVWDWERYDVGVPLGFDALHYDLQRAVESGVPHRAAAGLCVDRAPELLAPWSLTAAQSRPTVALYLAEIGLRYIADRQRDYGAAGGNVADWILPALRSAARSEGGGWR